MVKLKNFLKANWIILGIIVIFGLFMILYGKYLFLYFSQDDFFHFKVSQTDGSLPSFLRLFEFRSFASRGGIYFYRPIFREGLFNLYYRVFSLNPFPFRILEFAIHFVNIVLTYFVTQKIVKSKTASLIAAFFVGITAPNVGIISYLAGGIQTSGMLMFALLSLVFFCKYLERKKIINFILSFIFFLLSVMSHETASILPFLYLGIWFIQEKDLRLKDVLKIILKISPFFLVVLVLAILEVFVIGLPIGESQYGVSFSLGKLANSYFWYSIWSLGIPETLLDFVGPGIKLSPNLMRYWGDYYEIIFPSFIGLVGLISLAVTKLYKSKQFLFFMTWFLAGLLPVVFLPSHRQYHYLAIVLPAAGAILGLSYDALKEISFSLSLILLLTFTSLTVASVELANTNYWAVTRDNIARSLINDVKTAFPTLPKGAIVYWTDDPLSPNLGADWGGSSKQASIILSGSDALQLIYKDPTLKVYYEDVENPPVDRKIYKLTAIIYR